MSSEVNHPSLLSEEGKDFAESRDGKGVKNSTDEYLSPNNSTTSVYYATYCILRQNSVNSPAFSKI